MKLIKSKNMICENGAKRLFKSVMEQCPNQSATINHNSAIAKSICILFALLMVSGNVWGETTYYARLAVSANPTGGGTVYVNEKYQVANASASSEGSSANVTFNLSATANTGYTFSSWSGSNATIASASSTSTTATIKATSTESKDNKRTYGTATANFTANTYTVTFNGNGSTSGSMTNQSFTYDKSQNLSKNKFTKVHIVKFDAAGGNDVSDMNGTYTFDGWEDRGSIVYSDGTEYSYTTFDAPYYANTYGDLKDAFGYNKYDLLNHYIIRGKGEGRSCKGNTPGLYPDEASVSNLSTTNNGTVPLYAHWSPGSITLPNATRDNYSFEGWYDGDNKVGTAGQSYTVTKNVTLKAKWNRNYYSQAKAVGSTTNGVYVTVTESKTYQSLMDNNSWVYGTDQTSNPKSLITQSGHMYYWFAYRLGYTLQGWSTSATGSVISGSAPDSNHRWAQNATVTSESTTSSSPQWFTYYPIFTANQYAITLNGNGGNNGSATATYDGGWSTITHCSRSGYTLNGYYTATSGGTKVADNSGTLITSVSGYTDAKGKWIKADVATLYAQWTPIIYFIKYEQNGGSGAGSAPTQYTIESSLITLPTAAVMTKNGYDFGGWYEDEGCSGTQVTQITTGTWGNKTYYAKWTPTVYDITYYPDGGSGAEDGTYTIESAAITLPANMTKTGYDFKGWFDNAQFSGTAVTTIPKGSTGDKTFYAKWQAHTYTVNFNGNEATSGSTASKTLTYGSSEQLPANGFSRQYTVTFNLNGGKSENAGNKTATYTYTGWKLNNEGDLITDKATDTWNFTDTDKGTVTLFAQWTSASVTLPSATSETQGLLEGWYTNEDFAAEHRVGQAGEPYTPTATITLIARWVTPNYTVTFDKNGGSSVTPTSKTVTYYQNYGELPGLDKTLHDTKLFAGWYTLAEGGTEVTADTRVEIADHHTLFAHWQDVQTKAYVYVTSTSTHEGGKIAFSENKITDIKDVPKERWLDTDEGEYQTGKSHTYHLYARAATGYDFTKWINENNVELSTDSSFHPVVTVNTIAESPKEVKYFAIFTIHKWQLQWDLDGGTASGSYSTNGTYNYNATITAPTMRRYGYKFKNWNPAAPATMPDNDITCKAQWDTVKVSNAADQKKDFTAQTQTQTTTLTFPVTNATDNNDFNAPTLSSDTTGWTISSWNYDNNNVNVILSFTATENTTTRGNHVATVTLTTKSGKTATGTVTADVKMTPVINNSTIKSEYTVEETSINLNTAWTSTSNGGKTYSIESFTPDGEQSGATAPAINNNNVLSLGAAGTLIIKLKQVAGTSSLGYEGTKTITIKRITNTLSVPTTSFEGYVTSEWSNIYNTSSKNSPAAITTTSSDGTIAYFDVTANKILTPNSSSKSFNSTTISITIDQAQTYKYEAANKTVSVKVNKKEPSISSWNLPNPIYFNSTYDNVFSITNGDASLFSSKTSDDAVAAMTGLYNMQTFNKNASATITVTAAENYMWKGKQWTTDPFTPAKNSNHVSFVYDKSWYDNYTTKDGEYSWVAKSTVADSYLQLGKDQFSLYGFEGSAIFHFEGYPEKISFQVSTSTSISQTPSRKMYESTNGTDWGEAIWSYDWTETGWSETLTTNLKPTTRYIKFTYDGLRAGQIRYIQVTELQYLKTDKQTITFEPVTVGSESPVKSFVVQHCNAGYETSVTAPAHFQVSLDGTNWSNKVDISTNTTANTGGDIMGDTTVYVKCLTSTAGEYKNETIQVTNSLLSAVSVSVSSSITKMQPTCTWKIETLAVNKEISPSSIATITPTSELDVSYSSSQTDVAYFNDANKLITTAAGTTIISIHMTGNSMYKDTTFTKTIKVTDKKVQVISWTQKFDAKALGADRVKLLAAANSKLAVRYTSDNINVASVSQDASDGLWYVNFIGIGETNIHAHQDGNDTYAEAASVAKHILVYDASEPCPTTPTIQESGVTVKSSNSPTYDIQIPVKITFTSSPKSSTLYSRRLVVKQNVDGTWSEIFNIQYPSGECTITPAEGLSVDATEIQFSTTASDGFDISNVKYTLKTETTIDKNSLTFSAFPSTQTEPQTVKVSHSNRMILITSSSSYFTVDTASLGTCGKKDETNISIVCNPPKKEGSITGKIYLKDNTGLALDSISVSATVSKLAQTVQFDGLSNTYNTTDKVTLAASCNKSGDKERNFTFAITSGTDVAQLGSDGKTLTFSKSGEATIRVIEAGDNMYKPDTAFATITVSKVTPNISTQPTASTITYPQALKESKLTNGVAKVKLHGDSTVIEGKWAWTDSTETKTANYGTYKAYQVTFTPSNTDMYNVATFDLEAPINQADQELTWSQTIDNQYYNGSLTLNAQATTSGGGELSYSWTPDLATISGSTLTFNKGTGDITVTAHATATADYAEKTIDKPFTILHIDATVTSKAMEASYMVDADFIDLQTLWTTNGDGIITYSKVSFDTLENKNNSAGTEPYISDNRYLHLGQAGTLIIQMYQAQGSNYNELTDKDTIIINKHTPAIDWASQTYYFNDSYDAVYSVTSGDATLFSLTSSDPSVAVASGTGITTYNKPASTTLTVIATENYKWSGDTLTTSITPTANPNVPAFYYSKDFSTISAISYNKQGSVYWGTSTSSLYGPNKLHMVPMDSETQAAITICFGGSATKYTFKYGNKNIEQASYAIYAGNNGVASEAVWTNSIKDYTEWNTGDVTFSGTVNTIQMKFNNSSYGCEWQDMCIYGDAYILATDTNAIDFGVKKPADTKTETIKLAHANLGYISTISSSDSQFEVSTNGTDWASKQTISTASTQVTGGGKQGILSLYVKYIGSTEDEHEGVITICDSIGHSTTINVKGKTESSFTTTASWEDESTSYPVGNIANAFVARDGNNAVVAGTWSNFQSTNADAIIIQNGNIVAVCGGKTSIIKATFTPNDATNYQSCTDSVELTVELKSDTINWSKYEDINNEIHFWAYDTRTISDLASAHTDISYQPGTTWPEGVITITGDAITIGKKGEAIIAATSDNDCEWASASDTHTIYVDPCIHEMVWNQSFYGYVATAEGVIDQTENLKAYAVDSNGTKTNVAIEYTIAAGGETIAEILNGNQLHIFGAGTTTITATTVESDKYDIATQTLDIRVRKAGEACNSVAITPDDKTLNYSNTYLCPTDVPMKDLTYTYCRNAAETPHGTLYVRLLDANQQIIGEVNHISYGDMPVQGNTPGTVTKDLTTITNYRKAGYVQFEFYSTGGSYDHKIYLSDIKANQEMYFTSSVESISENVMVNTPYTKSITLSYSDVPVVQLDTAGMAANGMAVTTNESLDNDCGDVGSYTFTLSGEWSTTQDVKDTLRFYTSSGNSISIPIALTVEMGDVFKFNQGGTTWSQSSKWEVNGEIGHGKVPGASNPVQILNSITITEPVSCYQIEVADTVMITIAPTGGLSVYSGGQTNLSNHLIIKSSTSNQGFFRMSPEASSAMPEAKVEYATKGTLDHGANKDATWQYFGVPTTVNNYKVDYITWLYYWNETAGWESYKDDLEHTLQPWHGYTITQYGQPVYEWDGQLLNGNQDITLTKTGTGMNGQNMIANSYTSPIDVKNFTKDDFDQTNMEGTFYIYNSGSWNQWKLESDSGDIHYGQNPGQFRAIPILNAKNLDQSKDQTLIAPMQGICIVANDNAWIKFNYKKHVWNATADNPSQMNDPICIPSRDMEDLEDTEDYPNALAQRVRLAAYGANSGADYMYLMENAKWTSNYDNGYDALRMSGNSSLIGVYATESFGQATIAASNEVDSMFIGFQSGEDTSYEMFITSLIGQPMYLLDTKTNQKVLMDQDKSFTFTATPNTRDDFRFRIIKRSPEEYTGWEDYEAEEDARMWTARQVLYIADAPAQARVYIYGMSGQMIHSQVFSRNVAIPIHQLPEGCYMARVGKTIYKFVK